MSGGAFDKVDDPTALQPHDTAVTRNSTTGCINLSNVRVTARKLPNTNYLTAGLCPDGLPPGLTIEEGLLTGPLNLVDNGHVAFVENLGANKFRFYRFGIHSGGSDPLLDGLHMGNQDTRGSDPPEWIPNR